MISRSDLSLVFSGFLLASILLAVLSGGVLAAKRFEMVITPPKDRIVRVGATEEVEITITNQSNNVDNYNLRIENIRKNRSKEIWNAELENNRLIDIEPGESRKTYLKVTVPENAVKFTGNQIDIMVTNSQGKYLFSVDNTEMSDNLNQGLIPQKLENIFDDENYKLSKNASLSVEKNDKRWKITDKSNKVIYVVKKENNKLNIYQNFMSTDIVKIGAKPPTTYNVEYVITGVAVVVIGIAVVIIRWKGLL